VRDKLMHALRGPYLPVEEDDGSNEGRNFMFELAMAAKLWRAGLAPSLGEHPEIQCLVGDTPLYMQCKRVFVEHRVARCLERARGQLKSDLANGPAEACGLVAISLSRVLNAGDRVLEFSDADEASQHVERMLRELESRARAFRRRRARTPRILGVLFQASTPAAERQSGLIARLENMLLESMLPSVGDGQTLHDLNARLKIALRPRS